MVSPYLATSGSEREGTVEGNLGAVGMAFGGIERGEPVATRSGMESERNVWTTVSTFANNNPVEMTQVRKPARELTRHRASAPPAERTPTPTSAATESEYTDVDLQGEAMAPGDMGGEEAKKKQRKSGKTKEQRDKDRREKALSETSAKLEGTWEGYDEQERQERESGGVIDYTKLGFQ